MFNTIAVKTNREEFESRLEEPLKRVGIEINEFCSTNEDGTSYRPVLAYDGYYLRWITELDAREDGDINVTGSIDEFVEVLSKETGLVIDTTSDHMLLVDQLIKFHLDTLRNYIAGPVDFNLGQYAKEWAKHNL